MIRARLERGIDRVRARWVQIVQTAVAAGLAWELATFIQPQPFFAPIAAVITIGATTGQRTRRAIELALGVAVGILVADLLVVLMGTGAITVGVVVALAVSVALLLGAGQILVNQAAVSAVLLATLGTPAGESSFTRFGSALVGVTVAILIGPVLYSRDPLRLVGRQAERVLDRLADALDGVAEALVAGEPRQAAAALARARAADADIGAFDDELAAARDTVRLIPMARRSLPRLEAYDDAAVQVDLAVRNTRVLARAAETAAVRGVPADPDLAAAIHLLADAVRALGDDLRDPEQVSGARDLARQAARDATAVLDRRQDLSSNLIVAQIRSTAADILRGTGMDTQEMRTALGPYPGAANGA